jgi:hypothetical protein
MSSAEVDHSLPTSAELIFTANSRLYLLITSIEQAVDCMSLVRLALVAGRKQLASSFLCHRRLQVPAVPQKPAFELSYFL